MKLPAAIVTILWTAVISNLVVNAILNYWRGTLDRTREEEAIAARTWASKARSAALKKRVEAVNGRRRAHKKRRESLVELIEFSIRGYAGDIEPAVFGQF
jgi:hypothetical protein